MADTEAKDVVVSLEEAALEVGAPVAEEEGGAREVKEVKSRAGFAYRESRAGLAGALQSFWEQQKKQSNSSVTTMSGS